MYTCDCRKTCNRDTHHHIITTRHDINIKKTINKNTYFVITKQTPMPIPNAMNMQSTFSSQSQFEYKFTKQTLIQKKNKNQIFTPISK